MPELPEVETIVREIRPHLLGRKIVFVRASKKSLRRRWSKAWGRQLVGQRVVAVQRRGKWINVGLGGGGCLVVHLGMTGQFRVMPADMPLAPHTHLVLGLDDRRRELRFRDVRRFGSASFFPNAAAVEAFFRDSVLGPEPFDTESAYWRGRLSQTVRSLKAVLLDQRVVAGVGNIYADEALFEARLHPSRPGHELRPVEAERLRRAVVKVLNRAIERRGSTIRDYIGGSGERGGYQHEFRVYGRYGDPCVRCREPIERIRLAGRATHFCPRCQPLPQAALARDRSS